MEYSSKFSQEVRRGLEGLKAAIDKDLTELDGIVPNLSFSQADEILSGTNLLLTSYQTAMKPLYLATGRPSYRARPSGSSRSDPSAGPRGKMEPAALETMREQGYLVDKDFVVKYGFNRNAVSRKLQDMAQAYNWQRERTDGGWRYSPVQAAPETLSPLGATAPAGPVESRTGESLPSEQADTLSQPLSGEPGGGDVMPATVAEQSNPANEEASTARRRPRKS